MPPDTQELLQLVQGLHIPLDWDVLMVGDASGAGWNEPSGWGVKIFDRHSGRVQLFSGACSGNSTLLAELFPYLHAAVWHQRVLAANTRRSSGRQPVNVHVLTDCKSVADTGNDLKRLLADPKRLKLSRPFWAAFASMEATGYRFIWHWSHRETFTTNQKMNQLARQRRRLMKLKQGPDDVQATRNDDTTAQSTD